MTQPRLSTVYDFSNLRLHPDGTRVYQKADNVRPHLVRITSQGPRGTWIARDAGGSGKVSRYRKLRKDVSQEPGEEIDLDGVVEGDGLIGTSGEPSAGQEDEKNEDGEEQDESEDEIEGGKRKLPLPQHDKRKLKRRKFEANFEYLQESQPLPIHENQNSSEADNLEMAEQELPEPSPDFLKSIHRFAAEFYTERGQLLNISRQYRKERKLRRLQNLAKRGKRARGAKGRRSSASSRSITPYVTEEEEGLSEELPEEDDGEDDGEEEEEEEEEEDSDKDYKENREATTSDEDKDPKGKKKSQNVKGKGRAKPKRKGRRRSETMYTDMYKMFDGSAIMAIGMLVQETVAHMLGTEIPAAWQEEVDEVYGIHDEEEDEKLGKENEGQDRPDEDEDKDDEEEEEEEEEEDDDEEEDEQEEYYDDDDGDEEKDEDDNLTEANESRSPPLTKSGGISSESDADMKTGSDIETHDLDDDESQDSSVSD